MTRLLEKRRQMFEVQEALDAQKEEFARREEAARRREEELRKKDLDLQTSLIHYNKTITANEDKRQRALQRIQQESRAVSKKEAEIAELVARIRKDEAEQDERLQAIARVQQFHDYLQAVQLSHAEEFGEIPLIQRRFETLQRTNGQLRQRNEELEGELRRARQELERARSREITERLAQTLTATDMTGHFEGLVEDTEALSRREAEAAVGEHRRVSEFGVVLASVGNLFGRASRSGAGQRIRHFDDEAVAKEVLTSAQEVAEKEGTTLEALAPFMGASGAEAAAPGAASAGATSESKTAGRGAGAAAAAAAAAAAGSATATSAATGAAAAVSAAGDTADPAALKRMRRLAARAELTQATVLASARLTAVGAWVSDFSELAAAWARDERAVMAEERRREHAEADSAQRAAAAASSGLAGTLGGAGGLGATARSGAGGLASSRPHSGVGGGSDSRSGRMAGQLSARGTGGGISDTARGGRRSTKVASGAGGQVWHVRTRAPGSSSFGGFHADSSDYSMP